MSKNENADTNICADTNIYIDILNARAKMGRLLKDAKNPHFKSKYATLEQVHNVAIPAFAEFGILVVEGSRLSDGGPVQWLELRNVHTQEFIRSELPLVCKDPSNPQHLGSAQTYARRYLLQAMAGLTPEDDDGNASSSNRIIGDEAEKSVLLNRFKKALQEKGLEVEKGLIDNLDACVKDRRVTASQLSDNLADLFKTAKKV